MGDNSKIEWTEASWNPVVGCSRVSSGCDNCYAIRQAHRIQHMGTTDVYDGTTRRTPTDRYDWTGVVRCLPERLEQPLRWKRPRRIFVNSMSDLFHPAVPSDFVDQVFAVMALVSHHTFQVLTKRPDRMAAYFRTRIGTQLYRRRWESVADAARAFGFEGRPAPIISGGAPVLEGRLWWPLPNVWLGTSVEDQATADERIPHLLQCPAAVRWLSCEPLLGPVVLREFLDIEHWPGDVGIGWIVAGGESGPGARPMHPDWVRDLRDECWAFGVPFFFKQWGAFDAGGRRVGKHAAGRLLDGRTWDEYPAEVTTA